jgi:hypothetical protein
MRFQVASLIFLLTLSCKAAEPLPKVDRIEMRQSGWSAIDVEIDSRGVGRYELSDFPKKQAGSFSLTPQQHAALMKRLEPFQRKAEPLTDESINRVLEARCPKGVPSVTDAGGFWVHWVGLNYDHHYSADFGCDYERNRARNDELRDILRSLPVRLST